MTDDRWRERVRETPGGYRCSVCLRQGEEKNDIRHRDRCPVINTTDTSVQADELAAFICDLEAEADAWQEEMPQRAKEMRNCADGLRMIIDDAEGGERDE